MAFEINVAQPLIPDGVDITHTETRYIVARDRGFTDVLFDYTTSTDSELYHYENPYDPIRNEVLFYRVILKFDNGTELYSDIDTISYDKTISAHTTTIRTPNIYLNQAIADVGSEDLVVTTTPFSLFYTTTTDETQHKFSSWYVYSLSGELIWSREHDDINLTKMVIPKWVFKSHNAYTIEVVHESDIDYSYPGRLLVTTEIAHQYISMVSEPTLLTDVENIFTFRLSGMIRSNITYDIFDSKHNSIMHGSLYITRLFEPFNIAIDGRNLFENEDYYMIINGDTVTGEEHSQRFDFVTRRFSSDIFSRLSNTIYLTLEEEARSELLISTPTTKTVEINNGLVPIAFDNRILYYDYNRHIFNINIKHDTNLNLNLNNSFIDTYQNRLFLALCANDETDNHMLYKELQVDISSSSYTEYTLLTDRVYTYNIGNEDEVGYCGQVSRFDTDENNISPAAVMTTGDVLNFKQFDTADDSYIIANEPLDNLDELRNIYGVNDTSERFVLNTLYIIKDKYIIVEKNNIICRINREDGNIVRLDGIDEVVSERRTYLFETIGNSVVVMKEDENGLIRLTLFDYNTMTIKNIVNTDIAFDGTVVFESLDKHIRLLTSNSDGHIVYKLL